MRHTREIEYHKSTMIVDLNMDERLVLHHGHMMWGNSVAILSNGKESIEISGRALVEKLIKVMTE